jgi:hypothetical protein
LIILIILGEEQKLWSSSLCSVLQFPVTSSLLRPKILLSTLFSNTRILWSLMWELKYNTHTEPQAKL